MPPKSIRSTLELLDVLLAAANPEIVIADSAGVMIITSGPRNTVLAWKCEEVDVLRDSVGEPHLFSSVLRFRSH